MQLIVAKLFNLSFHRVAQDKNSFLEMPDEILLKIFQDLINNRPFDQYAPDILKWSGTCFRLRSLVATNPAFQAAQTYAHKIHSVFKICNEKVQGQYTKKLDHCSTSFQRVFQKVDDYCTDTEIKKQNLKTYLQAQKKIHSPVNWTAKILDLETTVTEFKYEEAKKENKKAKELVHTLINIAMEYHKK